MGSPIKELTGIIKSKEPNSASFKSKIALRDGILEAHVEKQNPDKKKFTPRAKRLIIFFSTKYFFQISDVFLNTESF